MKKWSDFSCGSFQLLCWRSGPLQSSRRKPCGPERTAGSPEEPRHPAQALLLVHRETHGCWSELSACLMLGSNCTVGICEVNKSATQIILGSEHPFLSLQQMVKFDFIRNSGELWLHVTSSSCSTSPGGGASPSAAAPLWARLLKRTLEKPNSVLHHSYCTVTQLHYSYTVTSFMTQM